LKVTLAPLEDLDHSRESYSKVATWSMFVWLRPGGHHPKERELLTHRWIDIRLRNREETIQSQNQEEEIPSQNKEEEIPSQNKEAATQYASHIQSWIDSVEEAMNNGVSHRWARGDHGIIEHQLKNFAQEK
jgi:hypothetical protein